MYYTMYMYKLSDTNVMYYVVLLYLQCIHACTSVMQVHVSAVHSNFRLLQPSHNVVTRSYNVLTI